MLALFFFTLGWVGYAYMADMFYERRKNLLHIMNRYRLQWMREMLKRDNRMMDSTMMGNLMRSISFFASTTIFILLGLVTLLGYRDEAVAILATIPFAQEMTVFLWEFKIFLLAIIFVYGFFKFTWSLRLYNYACVFIAAAPGSKDQVDRHEEYAQKGAKLVANAARHFNMGLRAYYFGLAALTWFIGAWLFMVATLWVVFVIYRREFHSHALNNLARD